MVSVYPMNISFYVLCISDLDRFLAEMWVLALQLKIQIYSTFCLTLVQVFLGMMMDLSARLISKRFVNY